MDTQQQIESIESDIKEAQKKLAESEQKLNALKAEQSKLHDYDGLKSGYLWDRTFGKIRCSKEFGSMIGSFDGGLYGTKEEAEWQGNSERVRRKLQRIAKALNPLGFSCYSRPAFHFIIDGLYTGIYFATHELITKAEEIIGDDIKYLNWYNSPEFKK